MDDSMTIRLQAATTYYQQIGEKPLDQLEAQAPVEWQIGDVILDLYEITALLGEGGMGKVFRAHHRGWNIDLAVKSPKAEVFTSQKGKELFIQEAETWVKLGLHPYIVSCYYVRTLGGVPRIFAECVEGGSLESWIESGRLYERGQGQALERILDIAIQFAWGLGYAHEQGLVHQDVKPHNVLMTPEGAAKVTDFGLVKAGITTGKGLTPTGSPSVSAGGYTPAYCSPEQAHGKKLDHRTDIWSWGVSVLEMFTGGVTWMSGVAAGSVLESFLETDLGDANLPAMPPALAELLQRCFSEDPEGRPADMLAIAEILKRIYKQVCGQTYPRQHPKAAEQRADSLNNKALSLHDLGRKDQSEELLRQALTVDALHPEATYHLALLQWRRGEIDDLEAVSRLERLLAALPERWPSAYLLGLVHIERGDLEKVLESLQGLDDHPEVKTAAGQARLLLSKTGLFRTMKGHKSRVASVAFSPDGRYALSGSGDKTLRLWEVETGTCVRTFEGHIFINSIAFSPNGRYALSGGVGLGTGSTLLLWELKTGVSLNNFYYKRSSSGGDYVTSVAFSPDGRHALSGHLDENVRLWDVETGDCLGVHKVHKYQVNCVAFSPNGQYILSGGDDHKLVLLHAETGDWEWESSSEGRRSPVSSVAFSPDGRYALSGSGRYDSVNRFADCVLRLWDIQTGDCLRTFEGHKSPVHSVAFSPDGRYALSCSGYEKTDCTIRLWNVDTGACLRTFGRNESEVHSVAFSLDGRYALSGSGGSEGVDCALRLWLVKEIGVFQAPFCLATPLSGVKATAQEQVFAEQIKQARDSIQKRDYTTALHRTRQARSMPGYERSEQALNIWFDLYRHCRTTQLRLGWEDKTLKAHEAWVSSVAFSPDGRYALSGSKDGTVRYWEVATGKCINIDDGHKVIKKENPRSNKEIKVWTFVSAVAFSPDGRYSLSSGLDDKTLRLRDIKSGTCVRTFKVDRSFLTVAFSPDGCYILASSGDDRLQLWEVETGKCLRTFGEHKFIRSVVFHPDGRYALTGGLNKTLRLWDVETGKCLRNLEGHKNSVLSVAFSPDGRYALSGSVDKTMRLWDVSRRIGACRRTFEGHEDQLTTVAFSPDGRHALSGSVDRTLRLWEIESGACLRVFEGHEAWVSSVAFSPDGRHILSGSGDNTLRLWVLDWELEIPSETDWHEGARPYLEVFLRRHTQPVRGLFKKSQPEWGDTDFQQLMFELGYRGYGWLRPEGVRRNLEDMARGR